MSCKGADMDKAGIREVAKAAGVSISTVSRAFTRPELVSERTRRKVLDVADRLDFNISRSATSLKSGQTYRVAMLMNEEITSWFNMEVFAGINSVMHDAGYDISLFQHVDTGENRRDFFTNLPVRRNVDAVFVTSFGVEPEEIQQLQRIHVPIIGINTPSQEGFDATISIDDEDGMFSSAQHLINLGHKNIVYVCSDAVDSINSSINARGQGFIRACKTMEGTHDFKWRVLSVPRGKTFADSALTALLALDEFPAAVSGVLGIEAQPDFVLYVVGVTGCRHRPHDHFYHRPGERRTLDRNRTGTRCDGDLRGSVRSGTDAGTPLR